MTAGKFIVAIAIPVNWPNMEFATLYVKPASISLLITITLSIIFTSGITDAPIVIGMATVKSFLKI